MSIAANVNDNLSISWGELKETYDAQDGSNSVADVEMKSTSIQFAYSMGSMSVKGYMTCLLYTSPSPRDATLSRMPSSA